jgi:hypothetical protein
LGRLLQAPSRTHCLLGQALRSCGDVEEVSGTMAKNLQPLTRGISEATRHRLQSLLQRCKEICISR